MKRISFVGILKRRIFYFLHTHMILHFDLLFQILDPATGCHLVLLGTKFQNSQLQAAQEGDLQRAEKWFDRAAASGTISLLEILVTIWL